MFTGIIKYTAKVSSSEKKGDSLFLSIEKPDTLEIEPGASIATNGVCLTVREVFDDIYTTELMSATRAETSFGTKVPKRVNLEPSLRLGDAMDGHIVTGHVDSIGSVQNIEKGDRSWRLYIQFPKKYEKLVVPKGSITIDGVGLTVRDCVDDIFTVDLVEYTITHTTLANIQQGDAVNLEYDIVGKYITKSQKYGNN